MQQIRQVNYLYAQRLAQGMTQAEAATSPYSFPSAGPTTATIKDGDTVESIAAANGVDVTNVLAVNPDMTTPKTGMVINLPRPGSEAWRVQNVYKPAGGIGLPSNAVMGDLATNQGINTNNRRTSERNPKGNSKELFETPAVRNIPSVGMNVPTLAEAWSGILNWQPAAMSGNAVTIPQNYNPGTPVKNLPALGTNYSRAQALRSFVNAAPAVLGKDEEISPWVNPYSNGYFVAPTPTPTPAAQTIAQATTTAAPFGQGYQYMSRNLLHNQIRTKVETEGYVPTPGELNILEKMGFVKRTPTAQGGGGGYSFRKGRGGGGYGGGYKPRYVQQGDRLPAFSTGQGIRGLVSWRI
jgi:LysM repeat protein